MSKLAPLALGLTLLGLVVAEVAHAGAFRVVPIRLFLTGRDKSSVLEITNQDKRKLTLQLDVRAWHQDDAGMDQYEPTSDIVFFPRIVTLEPDEKQVVRLGVRGKPTPDMERTYRFFIEELPVESPGGQVMLKFVLKIGVPIFISPLEQSSDWKITDIKVDTRAAIVTVKNSGNRHIQVGELQVKAMGEDGAELFSGKGQGWYVLGGHTRQFRVDLPEAACTAVRKLAVSVAVFKETSESEASVQPDAAQCTPPAEHKALGNPGGSR